MPLNQVASVSAPEPRLLTVTPFDKGQINGDREGDPRVGPRSRTRRRRAGVIRVPLPALNEQRRKELVKVVHKLAEEGEIGDPARADARRATAQEAREDVPKTTEAGGEGASEAPRRLHPQDRRADEGERSRNHGSLSSCRS